MPYTTSYSPCKRIICFLLVLATILVLLPATEIGAAALGAGDNWSWFLLDEIEYKSDAENIEWGGRSDNYAIQNPEEVFANWEEAAGGYAPIEGQWVRNLIDTYVTELVAASDYAKWSEAYELVG